MKNKLFKIALVIFAVVFVASCSKKMPEITVENKSYVADYLNDGFKNVDISKDGRLEKSDVEKIASNFNKPYDYNGEEVVNSLDTFFYGESFESPKDITLKNFVANFPSEALDSDKDKSKIDELKKQNPDAFKQTRENAKILKVDKNLVDAVLIKYANISSDDVTNKENVVYSKDDNSYYVMENDEEWAFEPVVCKITSKEIILEDDIKSELKLEQKNGKFFIKSFELSPNACCE
ncbi:hypothetical protein [Finegoldia magna]|uniref:hypothetical protein n=1 Tax=Finegoldia magna TaxID=1260 RepID=UPI002903417B|nr:hypothetical protein [Finegoldia magna]MDU1580149.1 hypothetical protein [Finegoldia magna]MDU1600885.1 hypothetical protein [Finegoldia magna]